MTRTHSTDPNRPRRVLVVASPAAWPGALEELVLRRTEGGAQLLLVAPAIAATPDDRGVVEHRLGALLRRLTLHGVHVEGMIGSSDRLRAVEDALRGFRADEVIVADGPRDSRISHVVIEDDPRGSGRTVRRATVAPPALGAVAA